MKSVFITSLFLVLTLPASAAEKWIRLSTANFELYTDSPEATGRKTIQYFEQLRSFYIQLPEYRQRHMLPVRVVQFATPEEFMRYKSVQQEAGHYESNGSRDWIALGPQPDADHQTRVIAHEYNHLIMRRAGLHFPHWLSEGIAELFSTVKASERGTTVGGLVPERVRALRTDTWLPMDVLTGMSDTSFDTMMNSSNGASGSLFYAEGWGLTHMLFLSPDYAANFPKLVAAFQGGHTTAEALPLAFDRTPEAIYGDLQSYWKRNTLEARVFSEKMDPTEVPVTVAPTTDFESSLMLVDLLAVMNKENGDAKPAFENLEKKFDAFEQIQNAPQDRATTLATMYFHVAKLGWGAEPADSKRLDKLERILDLPQVKNAPASRAASAAEMYYFFALLEREAKQPKDKVTAAFLQALQLQPDFQEARVKLGETYLYFNDAANARSAFVQVAPGSELAAAALNGLRGVAGAYMETAKFDEARAVAEESRPWVRTAGEQSLLDTIFLYVGERTSNASLQTGNLKEARAALESVRKLAKTPADIRDLDRLDGLITARSKGRLAARPGEKLLRADGTAQALDCPVSGALLRVLVGDKEMSFDLPDPAAVEVLSGSADLHCGKLQGFHIVVEYAPPGVASKASAGIVRRMAF